MACGQDVLVYNWGRQEGSGTSEEEFNSVFGFQLKIKKKKKKELKSQPLVGLFEIQSDSWEVVRDALSDELSSTGAAAPSKTQTLFQLISGGYSSHGSDSKQTVAFVCFASFFFFPLSSSPRLFARAANRAFCFPGAEGFNVCISSASACVYLNSKRRRWVGEK